MKDTTDCINESYKFVKGVDEITYGDLKAYTYEMKITGSKSNDTIWKEVMFEKGEYAYRLVMYVDKKYENPEQIISYVFDSAVFGEIDAEKVGLLLPPADEEVYEMKEYNFGEYLIDVPVGYETSSNAYVPSATECGIWSIICCFSISLRYGNSLNTSSATSYLGIPVTFANAAIRFEMAKL